MQQLILVFICPTMNIFKCNSIKHAHKVKRTYTYFELPMPLTYCILRKKAFLVNANKLLTSLNASMGPVKAHKVTLTVN